MARHIGLTNTNLYRTIVKTTALEDVKDDNGYRVLSEGRELTEIFGPYVREQDNRSYSTISSYKRVPTGEKNRWGGDVVNYVKTATIEREYQKLTPVFKKLADDTFVLSHEWIKYA
jgi:hypothetical protein